MAGTGNTGEFLDWDILDGADTVSSFTLAPSEAATLDKKVFKMEEEVIESAG